MTGNARISQVIKSVPGNRRIVFVVALFSALEMLDAALTCWAVKQGLVWEGNPLVADIAGNLNFVVLKGSGTILSALILLLLYKHFPRLSLVAGVSVALFYTFVIARNTGILISTILPL